MNQVLVANPLSPDCVAENIRKDKIINGVVGNLVPGLGNGLGVKYLCDPLLSARDIQPFGSGLMGEGTNYLCGILYRYGHIFAYSISKTGILQMIGAGANIDTDHHFVSAYIDGNILHINTSYNTDSFHIDFDLSTHSFGSEQSGYNTTGIQLVSDTITYSGYDYKIDYNYFSNNENIGYIEITKI